MQIQFKPSSKPVSFLFDLTMAAILVLTVLIIFGSIKDDPLLHFTQSVYGLDAKYGPPAFSLERLGQAFLPQAGHKYQPLVAVSHLLDYAWYGDHTSFHHLTNLGLHILNALLLFTWLRLNTGSRWRSSLIALFFALHPLNVEPVVWLAGRSKLMAALFLFLTLLVYSHYTKKPSLWRYILFLVFFTLGLMVDMILITLPFMLLLLDLWPLGRLESIPGVQTNRHLPRFKLSRLLKEKVIPLGLSLVCIVINRVLTHKLRCLIGTGSLFPSALFDYSVNGYTHFLQKLIWPFHLAIFYADPKSAAGLDFGLASLLTGGFLVFSLFRFKRLAFLIIGWSWYVLLLLPSLWFAPASQWALADQNAYLPLIGMFIALNWTANEIMYRWSLKPLATLVLGALICIGYGALANRQVRYWKTDLILFRHALKAIIPANRIHYYMGLELQSRDQIDEAASHYMEYLDGDPENRKIRLNLCHILMQQGRVVEAIGHYQKMLADDPQNALLHILMGIALETQGERKAAAIHYKTALKNNPRNGDAYYNCGNVFLANRKTAKAIKYYLKALQYTPGNPNVYFKLGRAYLRKSNTQLAIDYFQLALEIQPDFIDAHYQRGIALIKVGRIEEAYWHFKIIIELNPSMYDAHTQWGIALALRGRADEAINHFKMALRIQPDDISARNNLQVAETAGGDLKRRIHQLQKQRKTHPYSSELCFKLGACFYKRGDLKDAEQLFKKALVVQPTFTPALNGLADLYTHNDNYDQAIALYRRFLIQRPGFFDAYYHLACLNGLQGNHAQASKWLKIAVEAGFKDWQRVLLTPALKDVRTEIMAAFDGP